MTTFVDLHRSDFNVAGPLDVGADILWRDTIDTKHGPRH